jgi:hypothetical protein
MRQIPKEQVLERIRSENPWWSPPNQVAKPYRDYRRRAYFDALYALIARTPVRRAVLLMGPRRVGKTVLLHQVVQALLQDGVAPHRICYVSVDHPILNGCSLETFLRHYVDAARLPDDDEPSYLIFDEIQYLKGWEVHLKKLVDDEPHMKLVASGSAAAALRFKSTESGAGRFTDFMLPPLTFHEYVDLLNQTNLVRSSAASQFFAADDIDALNAAFVKYLNFGGYPEVIFSEAIQSDPARFIKSDIVDKVLLRDLPGLYGIQDIQELNYLFTTLAFNTAQEISLEQLSQSSGVAKNTIKRYIEYLEAAFLIKVVHRIDRSARRFQRANFFKVYLTNPSIRSALFTPLRSDDPSMGALTETGIFAQWFHADYTLHYARWNKEEVDIVALGPEQAPAWALEAKWSDRAARNPAELKSLVSFAVHNGLTEAVVTTRTVRGSSDYAGLHVDFIPASLYCYTIAYNGLRGLDSG